jgi:RNase P/RNase MRP subunit p30
MTDATNTTSILAESGIDVDPSYARAFAQWQAADRARDTTREAARREVDALITGEAETEWETRTNADLAIRTQFETIHAGMRRAGHV